MKRAAKRSRGFTLLELLVATAIMAIVTATVVPMISSITNVNTKAAAQELSGHIKYLFDRAILDRLYIRLVIDLETRSYWAESTKDPVFLSQKPLTVEEGAVVIEKEEDSDKNKQLFEDKVLFEDPANYKWQGWGEFADKFRKKKPAFATYATDLSKKARLPSDVRVYSVQSANYDKPVTSGQVWIHFFPNGYVERAAVALVPSADFDDPDLSPAEMNIYSVVTDPLTGRALIREGLVELKEDPDDEQPF